MYRLAIIEDNKDQYVRLNRRFGNINKDINLDLVENCETCEDVYNWIVDNSIECLLVDYKLSNIYEFTGAQLVSYINSKIPDLPCVILTAYTEDAEAEKLVVKPLIFDKSVMTEAKDSPSLKEFLSLTMHAVDVFKKRMENNKVEYKELLGRKEELNSNEYSRLEELFRILKSYKIIDDISVANISEVVEDKINNLIKKLDQIIED